MASVPSISDVHAPTLTWSCMFTVIGLIVVGVVLWRVLKKEEVV